MNTKRIIEISKKLGLSHISSCISVLPILEEIYRIKKSEDKVIMDNAHAHLAHLLFTNPGKAEELIKKDIHCNRESGCDAMGGSLGHGIGIAIGMALTDRKRDVHCIVSDGSMMEGSNWEALRLKDELKLDNLKIYCNFNGYSAVAKVDGGKLYNRMKAFCSDVKVYLTDNTEGFEGVRGHYVKL
jgi:transketolase N-terminal domain/subunit